jgi:type I restriction enzyme R subunit
MDGDGDGDGRAVVTDYTNTSPDPLATMAREEIGAAGMKIDREMFRERFAEQAREAAKTEPTLREAVETEDWLAVESLIQRLLFDKPKEFWNLQKIVGLYRTDRTPSLREILLNIYGVLPSIPTRRDVVDEAFERFSVTQQIKATHSRAIREVFNAFLLNPMARDILEHNRFAEIRTMDAGLHQAISALAPEERRRVLTFARSEVLPSLPLAKGI